MKANYLCPRRSQNRFDCGFTSLLNTKNDATAAASSAHFNRDGALLFGRIGKLFYLRCRHARSQLTTILPLFIEKRPDHVIIFFDKRIVHLGSDPSDVAKQVYYLLIAVDVPLENFPVVYSGISLSAGVT